jgi:hypothetical protein
MTAAELIAACREDESRAQRRVNAFVDEFRRASASGRRELMADAPPTEGRWEGLVAAVLSALCREVGEPVAPWVGETGSPEPFFAFPAKSYAMRVRLMIESPPAFKIRRVFVPADYLSRA